TRRETRRGAPCLKNSDDGQTLPTTLSNVGGEPQLSDILQDLPKSGLRGSADGSIPIQEEQPGSLLSPRRRHTPPHPPNTASALTQAHRASQRNRPTPYVVSSASLPDGCDNPRLLQRAA